MDVIIVTNHLYGIGGGARTVECIAKGTKHLGHNVTIASLSNIPHNVRGWIEGFNIVRYEYEMEKNFDVLWNVNHFEYVKPLAKRNLAFIFFPNRRNNPPPGYELFAVSKYSAEHIEAAWSRLAEVLYLPVNRFKRLAKKRSIVNIARFANPNEFADKAQIPMIETFEALQKSGMHDWTLTFVGGLDPGEGVYLDHLMRRSSGLSVEFLVNAPQELLEKVVGEASIYWHMTGAGLKHVPGAQEHYGLTVLEAQTAGAVPIVHGTGGMLETITPWYDGILVSDPQGLYDMTKGLADDLSKWAMMSQRAQESSKAWLGNNFVKSLEEIYGEQDVSFTVEKKPHLVGGEDHSRVTIVIPVHDQSIYTENLLKQLKTLTNAKVIVVDNASEEDHSFVEKIGYTYIRREENDGFAPSIAAAFPFIETDLTLLLNNDTMILKEHEDWLDILIKEINDGALCAGPKLIYPDGRIQFAGFGFNAEREDLFYHVGYGQHDSPEYNSKKWTFALTGACLLTKTDVLIELWDKNFKWNYEDVAYCLQVNDVYGTKTVYQPASVLVHFDGVTKRKMDVAEDVGDSKNMFLSEYSDFLEDEFDMEFYE